MRREAPLGRDFGWLWAAYAASMAGTSLAFDAFPIIAVRVLHSSAWQVSLLAAAGLAAGALVAVPLGPWVEFRRKRPVMVAMDLLRFAALLTVPAAYAFGVLTFAQLVVVSVLAAGSGIVFTAASGAFLKALVPPDGLLRANARFQATQWTAISAGPPLGGAAIGLLGPVTTVVMDAVSYLLSALGITMISGNEPAPPARQAPDSRADGIAEGWRCILRSPQLRPLFFCNGLVGGLLLATAPLLAVLLLRDLGFAPWQYGLAFGLPCIGGLAGARLAQPLVTRFGQRRVLLVAGTLRACWPVGLAFVPAGPVGLLLVIVLQTGVVTFMGIFVPVFATYRLEHTAPNLVARTLSAWTITTRAATAALMLAWGLFAALAGARAAIAAAGLLILATPLLLLRLPRPAGPEDGPAGPGESGAPSAARGVIGGNLIHARR